MSNAINSIKWQCLRQSIDNASSITHHLLSKYKRFENNNLLKSKQDLKAYNSIINLSENKSLTIGQLCNWVELNAHLYKGQKARLTKKDSNYIISTICFVA